MRNEKFAVVWPVFDRVSVSLQNNGLFMGYHIYSLVMGAYFTQLKAFLKSVWSIANGSLKSTSVLLTLGTPSGYREVS